MLDSLTRMERLIIAVLLIGGYYGIGGIAVLVLPENSPNKFSMTSQVLNTLGPLIGAIIYALFQKPVTSAEGRRYEVDKSGSIESSEVVNTNAENPKINFTLNKPTDRGAEGEAPSRVDGNKG